MGTVNAYNNAPGKMAILSGPLPDANRFFSLPSEHKHYNWLRLMP